MRARRGCRCEPGHFASRCPVQPSAVHASFRLDAVRCLYVCPDRASVNRWVNRITQSPRSAVKVLIPALRLAYVHACVRVCVGHPGWVGIGHWVRPADGCGWGEGVCQAYVLQRREAARAGMRSTLMIGGSALWGHRCAHARGYRRGCATGASRRGHVPSTYPALPACMVGRGS